MSDGGSVVTHLSDSMACWYQQMGGAMLSAQSPRSAVTAGSWVHCAPEMTNRVRAKNLLTEDTPPQTADYEGSLKGREDLNVKFHLFLWDIRLILLGGEGYPGNWI